MRVRGKRELRHNQKLPARLLHVQIHALRLVGKHAVRQHFVQQFIGDGGCVAVLNAQQHQQAVVNFANGFACNGNAGLGNSLD